MLTEGSSAVGAMSALYSQIEQRLLKTEDYRAMKALEKAIKDVQLNSTSFFAPLASPIIPSPSLSINEQQADLQQKIADRFASAAA